MTDESMNRPSDERDRHAGAPTGEREAAPSPAAASAPGEKDAAPSPAAGSAPGARPAPAPGPEGKAAPVARQKKTMSQLKGDARELSERFSDLSAMHTPQKDRDSREGFASVAEPPAHRHLGPVFWGSLILVAALILVAGIFPKGFTEASAAAQQGISVHFGWYYLVLVGAMVVLCLYFMLSPTGGIRLGDPDEKPRLSRSSWIAMLFSAGMGIGLVFWGAAEPLSHFASSAPEAPVGSTEALRDAFRYTFFHWGISAWAVYAIVALALAYFKFRKKEPALLSVTLKPLFGDRVNGPIGLVVDVLTTFATIIGVATSLGFGAMQINGGLNYLFGVPVSAPVQLAIIAITAVLYIASALSGLAKGVRILSNANVVIAVLLVAAALVIGPASQIMNTLVTTIGTYLQGFVSMSFSSAPFDEAHHAWIEGWTIFYWAWWIAWSPFVGVFIARISRGRTIREFLVCVILIPTIFSCIWFAVFGTLSTGAQISGADLASLPTETVLFAALAQYPGALILSVVALVLIFSFFITSADSATFVLGMITERGSLNPHRRTKLVWGVALALIAAVLLVNGGLDALQNVLIITALPFSLVVALIMASLFKELNHERLMMGLYMKPEVYPVDRPFRSYEDEKPLDKAELAAIAMAEQVQAEQAEKVEKLEKLEKA